MGRTNRAPLCTTIHFVCTVPVPGVGELVSAGVGELASAGVGEGVDERVGAGIGELVGERVGQLNYLSPPPPCVTVVMRLLLFPIRDADLWLKWELVGVG